MAKTGIVHRTRLGEFFNTKANATYEEWYEAGWNLLILVVVCTAIWVAVRLTVRLVLKRVAAKTKSNFDDILYKHNFFGWLSHIVPAIILEVQEKIVFKELIYDNSMLYRATDALIVFIVVKTFISFLNSSLEHLSTKENFKDKPLASYAQLAKIATYFIGAIIMFSLIFNKSPMYFLSAMGAMTAIVLLIFKDTILGFVASIQLSANDMVRIGDWISMPKYGADGDVTAINLTTVKVRNFDNTITTIPTYAFISDSFKNWRGMEESDGRRIKRAVHITINSVKFCDEDMLNQYVKIQLISEHITSRREEIEEYNKTNNIDKTVLINGRHMTNIGVFRTYLEAYILQNPNINKNMTCMVRQLPPSEKGLPIEIYAFSNDKAWVNFEVIIADIFDHIIAAAPNFGLTLFQNPTGTDFQNLIK